MSTQHSVVLSNVEQEEPTEDEVLRYAGWLGLDMEKDQDLLWIAHEGLRAPLPDGWKPCKTEDDEFYYFNFNTGESIWDHPLDQVYKTRAMEEKAKKVQREQKGKQMELKRRIEGKNRTSTSKVSDLSTSGSGAGSILSATPSTTSMANLNKLSPLQVKKPKAVLGKSVPQVHKQPISTTRVSMFDSSSISEGSDDDSGSGRSSVDSYGERKRSSSAAGWRNPQKQGSDSDTLTFSSNEDNDMDDPFSGGRGSSTKTISLTASSKRKSKILPSSAYTKVESVFSNSPSHSSSNMQKPILCDIHSQTEISGEIVPSEEFNDMEKHMKDRVVALEGNLKTEKSQWQLEKAHLEEQNGLEVDSVRHEKKADRSRYEHQLLEWKEKYQVETESYEKDRTRQCHEITTLKETIEKLEREDKDKRSSDTKQLQREVEEAKNKLLDLENSNNDKLRSMQLQHEEEISRMEKEYSNRGTNFQEEKERSSKENERIVTELKRKIRELERTTETSNVAQKLRETEAAFEHQKTEKEELKRQLDLLQEKYGGNNAAATDTTTTDTTTTDTAESFAVLERELKTLHESELSQLQKENGYAVEMLRGQLESTQEELQEARDLISQSTKENDDAVERQKYELARIRKRCSDLETTNHNLQQQLSNIRTETVVVNEIRGERETEVEDDEGESEHLDEMQDLQHRSEILALKQRIDSMQREQAILHKHFQALHDQKKVEQQDHKEKKPNLIESAQRNTESAQEIDFDKSSAREKLMKQWKENAMLVISMENEKLSKIKKFISKERKQIRKRRKILEAVRDEWRLDFQRNAVTEARGAADDGKTKTAVRDNDTALRRVRKLLDRQANRLNEETNEINKMQSYYVSRRKRIKQVEDQVREGTHPQLKKFLGTDSMMTTTTNVPELQISSVGPEDGSHIDEKSTVIDGASSDDSNVSNYADFNRWWESQLPHEWSNGGIRQHDREKGNRQPGAPPSFSRDKNLKVSDLNRLLRELLKMDKKDSLEKAKRSILREKNPLAGTMTASSALPSRNLATKYERYFDAIETKSEYPSNQVRAFQRLLLEWDAERDLDREYLSHHGEWLRQFHREMVLSRHHHAS